MNNRCTPWQVALAALILAACGSTTVTGQGLAAKMESEALAPKGITNADGQVPGRDRGQGQGATVECAVTADGKKGNVTAKFADDEGALTDYQANVDDIQVALIENNAEEAGVAASPRSTCPASSKPKKGATFFCTGDDLAAAASAWSSSTRPPRTRASGSGSRSAS